MSTLADGGQCDFQGVSRRVSNDCEHVVSSNFPVRGDGWRGLFQSLNVMWLIRVFESSFVRKIAYMLAALAFGLVAHKAHAANTCAVYHWMDAYGHTGQASSAQAAGSGYASYIQGSSQVPAGASFAFLGVTSDNGTSNWSGATYYTACASGCGVSGPGTISGAITLDGPCPLNNCTATKGYKYDMVSEAAIGPNGTACGNDGCSYSTGAVSEHWVLVAGGTKGIHQDVSGSGDACSLPSTSQIAALRIVGQASAGCSSGGGNVVCSTQDATGKNCGTFNGDKVCVTDIPAGKCISYASGGIACTQSAGATTASSPPSPNSGVAGTPATPSETVTNGSGVTNYYNSSAVANSTTSTVTSGGGTGGTSNGGAATGSGPSAANGDCGADGVNCGGDGGVPSLTRADTIQSNVQSYMNAVSAAPIVAGISSIASSFPTAAAPTVMFSLWGHSFDAFAPFASIWGGTVAPTLSLVFLAMWAVAGARVILSA